MPTSVSALVGRGAELTQAATILARAAGGAAAAVIVDGDAGVGKTRLITELVTLSIDPNSTDPNSTDPDASHPASLALIGHCVDLGDTPPPYLPLVEAFGRLPVATAQALVEDHPAIARLLPGRAGSDETRIDRGAMLDSVVGALVGLARLQPVLLVIEDLHWADVATRDLLGFLFTRMGELAGVPLGVLATVRSDDLQRRHPLRGALAEWSRLSAVHRLHLDPLSAPDVTALVRALDARIGDDALADIVRRADGNAFFAEELLDTNRDNSGELPWALADLLLVRLDPLEDDSRELVRVAAVAGRSVSHDLLRDVVGLPDDRFDAAVRQAVEAHVLQTARDSGGSAGYRFRHALLGEAVYDDLLPGERVRIHAAYAARLDDSPHLDVSAAELARHALAAHDLPAAYAASVRAAEQALAVGAPYGAVQHLQSALELFGQLPETPTGHAQLVLAFVDACIAAGRSRRAERIVRDELSRLPDDAAPGERVYLLYALAKASMAGEFDAETVAAIRDAMQLTDGDPPSELRADLLVLHARLVAVMGRDAEAERAAQEAVDVATAASAPAALINARSMLAIIRRRFGDPEDAAAALGAAAEQARQAGELATEVRIRFQQASVFHEQGRLLAAQQAFAAAAEHASAHGRTWDLYSVTSRATAARLQYERGHWDEALAVLDTDGQTPPPVSAAILESAGLFVRAGRGESDTLQRAAAVRPHWGSEGRIAMCSVFATLPLFALDQRAEDAVSLADELVDFLGRLWMDPWFLGRIETSALVLDVLARCARTTVEANRDEYARLGRRFVDDAHECAARCNSRQRRLGVEGRAWLARADAAWASLRWAAGTDTPTRDELVQAWHVAEQATDYDENVIELARVRASLADVLHVVGLREDSARVAALARPVAKSVGDVIALDRLRSLSVPLPAADRTGQPLTPREHDVLALVAEGRSNRQIANHLYISEKTVSVHVSNILAKLGAKGRTEAAATARRDGLLG